MSLKKYFIEMIYQGQVAASAEQNQVFHTQE